MLFLVSLLAGNTLWAAPTGGGDDPFSIFPSPFLKLLPTKVFPKIPLKSPEGEVYQKNQTTDVFELVKNSKLNVKTNQIISFDPVRFSIRAKSDSILLGKEIELTIKAEFLDVHPQLMFTDEGSNEFTLKMLFPKEFVVTGGSYYDFIRGKVSKESPTQTFTVKGYFGIVTPNAEFRLLRSHNEATSNDYFVVKSVVNFKQVKNKEIFLLENPNDIDKSNNRIAETQNIQDCFGDFKIAVSTSASGNCQLANGEQLKFVGVSCPSPATITWYKRGDNDIASQVASIGGGLTFQNAFDPTKQIYFAKCSDGVCTKITNEINFVFREYISPNGYPSTITEQRFYCPTSPTPQILTASCVPGLPLWSNGSTANTITITSATPTTYSYTCTRSACTANPSAPTYYQYVIIENCSGGNGCTPFAVNASNNSPNQEVTPTANLNLSVTTADPLATFIWTGPNNFYSNSQNPIRINTTSAMNGIYTVTVTNSTGCVSIATTSVFLKVIPCTTPPAPKIYFRTINKTTCDNLKTGDTIELTAVGCDFTVHWDNGQTGNVRTSILGTSATTYTAKCVDRTCESLGFAYTITPNSVDIISFAQTIPCNGNSLLIAATCLPGVAVWSDGTESTTYLAKQPGRYNFQCKNSTCTPWGAYYVDVIVSNTAPTLKADKTVFCNGGTEPVTITASGCTGTVIWSGSGTINGYTGFSLTTRSQDNAPSAQGNYSAICSTTCGNSPSSNVIYLYPIAPISVIADNNSKNNEVSDGGTLNLSSSVTITNPNFGSTASIITYRWTGPNNFSSTQQNPSLSNVSYLASGVYTILIGCAEGCSVSATTNVILSQLPCTNPPIPSIYAKTINKTNCNPLEAGDTIEMTATGCAFTIVWGGGQTGSVLQVTMPAVVTTYTAKCVDRTCQSPNTSITLTPNASTIGSQNYFMPCNGTVTMAATCLPGIPQWTNGPLSSTYTVSQPGTYTFQCKNGTCPVLQSSSSTVSIQAPTAPIVNANKTAICGNSPVTLTTTNCTGTVNWSGTGITASTTGLTYLATIAGNYSAICSTPCGDSNPSNAITLTSAPALNVTASSNSTVTVGQLLSLSANSTNTNIGYTWTGPNNFTATIAEPNIFSANLLSSGVYTVTIANAGGCTATATTNVVVLNTSCPVKPPTLTVSANKSVIPFGGAVTLTAQSCAGTVLWTANAYDDPNNIPRVQKSTFTSNPVNGVSLVTVNPPGNALSDHAPSVVYTAQCLVNGCLSDSTTQSQVVIQLTDFPCLPPDNFEVIGGSNRTESIINGGSNQKWKEIKIEVCPNESYTLTATGCTGTVAWGGFSAVTTSYPAGGTSRTVQASAMQTDEVTYSVSCPADFCPSPNANIYITVTRKSVTLTADNNSKNGEIAAGGTVNLSASSTATGLTYAWAGPNNFTSALANPIISSATVDINGTYTVTATNTAGCVGTATTVVKLKVDSLLCESYYIKSYYNTPLPDEETTKLRRIGVTNTFEPISLTLQTSDSASTTGLTYLWLPASGLTISPNNTASIVTANKIGEYKLTISNGANSCDFFVDISGKPCNEINTGAFSCSNAFAPPIATPNQISNLAVGDEFYAADYKFEIIRVDNGSLSDGWSGEAVGTLRVINGFEVKIIRVEFTNISLDDCYRYVGTASLPTPTEFKGIRTKYDPEWKNFVDVNKAIKKILELFGAILEKTVTWANIDYVDDDYKNEGQRILDELIEAKSAFENTTEMESGMKADIVSKYAIAITDMQDLITTLNQTVSANQNLRVKMSELSEAQVQDLTDKKSKVLNSINKAEMSPWESFKAFVGTCFTDYLNQDEGIVPRCLWGNVPSLPGVFDASLSSGVIDGLWDNTIGGIIGVFKIIDLYGCYDANPIVYGDMGGQIHRLENVNYYTPKCVNLRKQFPSFGSMIKDGITKPFQGNVIDNFVNYMSCSPTIQNVQQNNCIRYRLGKTAIDAAFIALDGYGLAVAGIKAVQKTATFVTKAVSNIRRTITNSTTRTVTKTLASGVANVVELIIDGKPIGFRTDKGLALNNYVPSSQNPVVAVIDEVDLVDLTPGQREPVIKGKVEVHQKPNGEYECTITGKCFLAGTKIKVKEGYKNIENINTGDFVWSKDVITNEEGYKAVTRISQKKSNSYVEIKVGKDTIKATSDHPFWVNNVWIDAGKLKKGDILSQSNQSNIVASNAPYLARSNIEVDDVSYVDSLVEVYNFEVQDFHTYFVGLSEVLVHNGICNGKDFVVNRPANEPFNPSSPKYNELEIVTWRESRKVVGDNLTPHHVPSRSFVKNLKNTDFYTNADPKLKNLIDEYIKNDGLDAPCIMMEETKRGLGNSRHGETITYANQVTPEYRAYSPKEAFDTEMENLRDIYRKYSMYDEVKSKQIDDFAKKTKNYFSPLLD